MITIIPGNTEMLFAYTQNMKRSQLQYFEYTELTDTQLKNYFFAKNENLIQSNQCISFFALSKNKPVGFICLIKDGFDSELLELNCFKITELSVQSENFTETNAIVTLLLVSAEKAIGKQVSHAHISIGLNNNTENSDQVFNSLTKNGFYFIHTLLTFKSGKAPDVSAIDPPGQNLIIRTADKTDSVKVAQLAQKSFKYSRFHLDPYIDDKKAGRLMSISAENSILRGFADVVFVALVNGEIAGYYSARKKEIKEFGKVFGEAIISAVDKNYRGTGIFSKMDDYLQNWLSEIQ
jgi:hypothetical protein